MCVECKKRGKVTIATLLDHIIPISKDPSEENFWDSDNHQALCVSCHNAKTGRSNGQLIDNEVVGSIRNWGSIRYYRQRTSLIYFIHFPRGYVSMLRYKNWDSYRVASYRNNGLKSWEM